MSDTAGFTLHKAEGARRLTVHCRYCGETLRCPKEESNFWSWLKLPEVVAFYAKHREHAGAFADATVGAEIEFDEGLLPKQKDDLPPLINLLEHPELLSNR